MKSANIILRFERCVVSVFVFSILSFQLLGGDFGREIAFKQHLSFSTRFCASLEELVSKRGEKEAYAPCSAADTGIGFRALCDKRDNDEVWDAFASVTNLSSSPRFLRLVFRAKIDFPKYTFWNGYLNQANNSNTGEGSISSLFPAIAAVSSQASLVLGLDPSMNAARVDTSKVAIDGSEFLEFAFPVYLPQGDGFTARMALATARSRYLWHDVVERWYELFPEAFAPADNLHPGVASAEANYMFWKCASAGISNENDRAFHLRKAFGDKPCWDWCYKPFIRGGDWAISEKWCVGWQGHTAESVAAHRAEMRRRIAEGSAMNVAPMWYLNVCWTEKDMGLKEFPGIQRVDKPIISWIWQQDTLRPIYCGGNTPYEKLFRDSIVRIPREFPGVKGIAWDSCFANSEMSEDHVGFAGTPCKSFREGIPFVHEAIGISGLLDLNHKQFSSGNRMANAVNYKLVAPWMIGVRTDTGLYEGTPMTAPERLWRIESLRARLGPKKVMCWHKGCAQKNLKWAKLDKMASEEREDVHRQILDDNLFLCYYWGTAPGAAIPCENRERLVGAVGELVDLITSGWHPSPACDAPEGILVARYGDGAATRFAVINPGYERREVELALPEEYWPQYKGGRKSPVTLPARQVAIVKLATGEAREAATLPPSPTKKVFDNGLMPWMNRSGLLGFIEKKNKRR